MDEKNAEIEKQVVLGVFWIHKLFCDFMNDFFFVLIDIFMSHF